MYRSKYTFLFIWVLLNSILTTSVKAQEVKTLKKAFKDMVYVPQQERFYAVNSVYDNPSKSMLYRINPYTASIEDSVQIGYYIHRLDVTDDGRFLYIAEYGTTIYRYDLSLKKIVLTLRVTNPRPFSDSVAALVLRTVPKNPNSLVVIRNDGFSSYPSIIHLYEDANVVATSGSNSEYQTMAFGKNPNILYVYDSYSSGELLYVLERQGTKWEVIRTYSDFIGTFSGNLKVDDDGYLYADRGKFRSSVLNIFPEIEGMIKPQLEPNAWVDVPAYLQGDPIRSVIYALSSEYQSAPGTKQTFLSTYSKSNYLLIKKTPLNTSFGYFRKFGQWGSGRLAGMDETQIIFVRDCTPSVTTPPLIEQGSSVNVCPDSAVTLTASAGFSNYFWTTGDTGRTIKIKYAALNGSALSVAVAVAPTQQSCLSSYSNVTFILPRYSPQKPTVFTDAGTTNITLCQGDSTLAYAVSNETNSFLWSNGTQKARFAIKTSGVYSVKAISTEGCPSPASEPITITVRADLSPPRPVINISGDTALCTGEQVTLSTPLGYATYEWINSLVTTSSITVNPLQKTTYGVRVTTAAGCKSGWSNFITAQTYSTPDKPIITANKNCMATQVVAEKYQWYWNNNLLQGETGQFLLAQQHGVYTVKAFNKRCASIVSDSVQY
jgi:hypothetical protein